MSSSILSIAFYHFLHKQLAHLSLDLVLSPWYSDAMVNWFYLVVVCFCFFGWSRKAQLYCFARQRGPQQAHALKTVCPNLEGEVRSFTVMVQREGRDQLVDILLIGWWGGKWELASSAFWFNRSGVYVLVGSIELTSPTWWGFQYDFRCYLFQGSLPTRC